MEHSVCYMARPASDLPFAEFARRLRKLETFRRRAKLDAVLILSEVNIYYFTGLTDDNAVLLAADGKEPVFYTDFRYLFMARRKAPGLKSAMLWPPAEEQDFLSRAGKRWHRVGYEGTISAARFLRLREALPDVEWVDVASGVMEMRSVKSPAEQRVMRRAIATNDKLFALFLSQVKPGQNECEMKAFIKIASEVLGQGEAFDTIACVGRNAAECHHEPDLTLLKPGEPILVDLGVRVDHYCSDMTRCVSFGKPTKLYRELFKIVHAANRAAAKAVKPGMRCSDIDAIARNLISRAGYGEAFGHSLGHSLGLEIHEMPCFSPHCDTILKPGMFITDEPGIYLPGKLGIRLEDVILVTRDGCEVVSQTPHDLAVSLI